MESNSRHALAHKKPHEPFAAQVDIHVRSYRCELADSDGVSAKAIIDGIVHSGLLQDDSTKYVASVTYSQERVSTPQEERTVVTMREVV